MSGKVEETFNDVCKNNRRAGVGFAGVLPERLGHIRPAKETFDRISYETYRPVAVIQEIFEILANPDLYDDDKYHDALAFFAKMGANPASRVSGDPIWLFLPTDDDPVDGTDLPDLPWRLGLPAWTKIDGVPGTTDEVKCFIYWFDSREFRNLKAPSPLDADYEGLAWYWTPNGRTATHSHGPCPTAPGLEEIVTEPPTYEMFGRSGSGKKLPKVCFFKSRRAP